MKVEPDKWRNDYDRDGYLVIEDVLGEPLLLQLRDAVDRLCADPDKLPPHLIRLVSFERDWVRRRPHFNRHTPEQVGNAIRNVRDLSLFDPIFAEMIFYDPQLDILDALFRSTEYHFLNYKCIIKAPFVGSAFRWHRDYPYLEHTTTNIITSMLCLDDMISTNGATVVLPGSQRIAQEQMSKTDIELAEEDLPRQFERETVCCPAGSAVLFHANIIHGGGPNESDMPRRNLISIWPGPDTHPITAARQAHEGLMPRSRDRSRQKQVAMTRRQIEKSLHDRAGRSRP